MGAYADKMAAIEEAERMAAEQMAGTEIPYAWQAAHEFYGENRGPKVPNIWEVPFIFQPTDPKLRATPIVQPPNQLTRQPFNPYDIGVASYLRNVWDLSLERAKQENTTPKYYIYGQPQATGSGTNTGAGGVIGWFRGLPEYLRNQREKSQKQWEEYKADLEERRRLNENQEGQNVISDQDKEDPKIIYKAPPGDPSGDPGVIEKANNTWDDFIAGVKAGWDAGGMKDYKTPLLIAGGVVVLILIIK